MILWRYSKDRIGWISHSSTLQNSWKTLFTTIWNREYVVYFSYSVPTEFSNAVQYCSEIGFLCYVIRIWFWIFFQRLVPTTSWDRIYQLTMSMLETTNIIAVIENKSLAQLFETRDFKNTSLMFMTRLNLFRRWKIMIFGTATTRELMRIDIHKCWYSQWDIHTCMIVKWEMFCIDCTVLRDKRQM